ncbi:MAG TPA: siderophore-interacting protein [Acidimicrobiales bacterium]|nr:siderophore-interacting protein [Acidimicrobiales bacterium]
MTDEPDDSSQQLAGRVGATASLCEVVSSTPLSTSIYELVLRGNAATLAGVPGNDVMIRLVDAKGRYVRRRYSVRALDAQNDEFTLWLTVDHDGPGTTWVKGATKGELVDVIGPRGKVLLDPLADWHLFLGDASGLAAFYRMAQSIEVPGKAIFIVEIDAADDALSAPFAEGLGVTGIFVDRRGRSTSDAEGLMRGLAAFELPPDLGHAYLFGEFHIMRVLESALLDRGLAPDQISHKAFWRSGRSNADHGEPIKTEA